VLTEIRRCYTELDKFWTEEISRAFEAFEMRRVDPTDFERWKNFHADLKQTIETWKVQHGYLFLCCALPTDQNTLFRMSYQVVMLKLRAATMHARLRFAHSHFHCGIPLD
jgi:N-formylglutamate amidohydrolase